MSKLAKQPDETSWQGLWAQAVVRSLQQLEAQADAGSDGSSGASDTARQAQLDEELCGQVLEGLNQPLDTFHDALNRLGHELSRHGIEQAYSLFTAYLDEAAQTLQWEQEIATAKGLRHEGGRSSLFGLGLLILGTSPSIVREWTATANEQIAALLVENRQLSAHGRVVLLPVGLNSQETVELEPWMGYRLTTLLHDWVATHPEGHPSVSATRAMLASAGINVAPPSPRLVSASMPNRSKHLRHLTLLGLHVPPAEEMLTVEPFDSPGALNYDFPLANFAAGLATDNRALEDAMLALALRQGSSQLGASAGQAQDMAQRFSDCSMAELLAETKCLSSELDGLRAAHPDLTAAHYQTGFAQSVFAKKLSTLLGRDILPPGELLEAQPAWPTTFVFEAAEEGLKAYRDLCFRSRASIAAEHSGLARAQGLVASIDHDVSKREFQVLLRLPTHHQVAGFSVWAGLPRESAEESLMALQHTLQDLGVVIERADTGTPSRVH